MQQKNIKFINILIVLIGVNILLIPNLLRKQTVFKTYEITQLGNDESGYGKLSYIIKTLNEELVIIDGGWEHDSKELRKIISKHNNIVDAWIITHPHQDHFGAFIDLMKTNSDIEVKTIYAPNVDYNFYEINKRSDYELNLFKDFNDLTKNMNILYLSEGDVLDLFGLEMKVFNATTKDSPSINDSSLVFKLSGKKNTFLFTGDCGKIKAGYIIEKYGSELKSDYLQVAHHGMGGPGNEFYNKVNPEYAFIDAPKVLRANEVSAPYSCANNIKFFENMGTKVITYETAPNTILFE